MFGIKIISEKKFKELESTIRSKNEDIRNLKIDLDGKNKELSKLKSAINGELVCGRYCEHCEHGLQSGESCYPLGFGEYEKRKVYICALSTPCQKFNRIEPK